MKRAVIYLRVSTKEQARRDGNPEGYSLPTQRQTATAKAGSLGAVVVDEYHHDNIADERQRQNTRLRQLDDERTKLLHAYYQGAIPLELLKTEQERITTEASTATARLEATAHNLARIEETVQLATQAAANCLDTYKAAGPQERRLMNQALFHRIWVDEDGVAGWEYNDPFSVDNIVSGGTTVGFKVYERRSPGRRAGALHAACSKAEHLADWMVRLSKPHSIPSQSLGRASEET